MIRSPSVTESEIYFVVVDGDGDDPRISHTPAATDPRECSVLSPPLTAASDTSTHFLLLSIVFTWPPGYQCPLVFSYLSGCSFSVSFADPASSPWPLCVGGPGFSLVLFSSLSIFAPLGDLIPSSSLNPICMSRTLKFLSPAPPNSLPEPMSSTAYQPLPLAGLRSISSSTCPKPIFCPNLLYSKPSPSQLMATVFFWFFKPKSSLKPLCNKHPITNPGNPVALLSE